MEDHKPSRVHRFFSGIFHHRSRSRSPKPQEQKQTNTSGVEEAREEAFRQNDSLLHSDISAQQVASPRPPRTLEPADDQPDMPRQPGHAAVADRRPGAKVSGTAYDEAWSRLGEGERASLSDETSIRTLFERLDEADQQHQSSSWLARGRMAAGLRYVGNICSYVDLVAAWVPFPDLGAVVGLFRGVIAIAVGMCGAYDGLTGHIRAFLDHVPVIERCNTVLWSNGASSDIHNILVACYSTLLSFYSKVLAFLQEESRIRRVLETFRSDIPGIVADFNGHADKLSKMMEVETLVTVKKILDQQTEKFVNDNLYRQRQNGSRNADQGSRSDEACQWVIREQAFGDWAYGPHGVLTMYGVVGCGKTATASYVAEYLRAEARAPVLAYYCAAQEEDELRLILCSLTYQLLQARAGLKARFREWSDQRQATTLDKPSNRPAVLAEFLGSALQDPGSGGQVFIVVDGLDECDRDARGGLLALLRDVIRKGAPVKVFVSSRQREDILQTLAGGEQPGVATDGVAEPARARVPLFHIDMAPTEERDRILAEHLAARHMRQVRDGTVRARAVGQVALRARGSAIWLRMAMASLEGARNERRIERCLEFLETDPQLVDWYERLFRDAEAAACDDREVLERALETLAVARRPMAVGELARAVHVGDAGCGSLDALDESAEEVDFLGLVRPFVATLEGPADADGRGPRVCLVHQSLLELLLTARPSEWGAMASTRERKRATGAQKDRRGRELNEKLAGRCVKYLLLAGLEGKPSGEDGGPAPAETAEEEEEEGEEEDLDFLGFDDMFAEPEAQKRAQTRARISHLHLYEYAALNWAGHFAACEADAAGDLRDDALTLLDVTASGCTDWVSFVRAEKKAEGEPFPGPGSSEPATLAAYFGLGETLRHILAGPGAAARISQAAKDEALFWAARGGREPAVRLLLGAGAEPNRHLADDHTALTAAAEGGHLGCARALLADPRTDVNARGARSRTALSFAAGGGHHGVCAALVRHAACRPDEPDWRGMTPLFYAAAAGHLPVVRALAALPAARVNHRDCAGRTALCHAAGSGAAAASLAELLAAAAGVDANLPDREGRSPLAWAALKGDAACVDALLRHPAVDRAAVHPADRKNAIHFACEAGSHQALLCLLRHGCPGADDPDVDGWTPLMWAIQNGPQCVSALLATGRVEVERRDRQGKTALALAVQWGHLVEVIRILLRYGADPETVDDSGQTPVDVAIRRGLPESLRMADELSSWISRKRGRE